jgi:[CysO sulfur-carrier protein]-S-L-cysteine hydrolase
MKNNGAEFSGSGLKIHFPESVWNKWKEKRQKGTKDYESFGVLIGSSSLELKEFWIESVTTPYQNDKSSRHSFHLKDKKHQKSVDLAFDSANGELIYLGTWHTHPEKYPTPSAIDLDDWHSCIKRNPGRKLFFVIVGTEEIYTFSLGNNEFFKLDKTES